MPSGKVFLVEPIEEVEARLGDADGRIEDLFDLTPHHPEELVGCHELQFHRGVADALACLFRSANEPVVFVARHGAEAPENLAEPLGE